MRSIKEYLSKRRSIWIYILTLFIVTRLVFAVMTGFMASQDSFRNVGNWKQKDLAGQNRYLSSWAVWDSNWYLGISQHSYASATAFDPNKYSSVGFFPLYPLLIYIGHWIFGDYLLSGFIISNLFLLLAAYTLYILVGRREDEATAKRSVLYLFLFPSAYIFSSIYPESLLLFLWLCSVLAAEKDNWWMAGLAGMFAAMTKPYGILILIPVVILYAQKHGRSLKDVKLGDLAALLPVPVGLLMVAAVDYAYTHDFFAYVHVQQGAWAHKFMNPLWSIYDSIFHQSFDWGFNALTLVFFLAILIISYKKIPLAYWAFALAIMIFIPANGQTIGVLRYLASVFPLVILMAKWGKAELADRSIIVSAALLQGFLFVYWVTEHWILS